MQKASLAGLAVAIVLVGAITSAAPGNETGDDARPEYFRKMTIPVIDLSPEKYRQIIVESTPGQYLGHPTTVLLRDKSTILVTYPLGHGGPAAVLKKSEDGGLTWSKRLPVPANWATATNCPCIHRLTGPDGIERLFVFEGRKEMRQAVSLDNGKTWTPFKPNGLHCVVAPITIIEIQGKRHLAVYQRGPQDGEGSPQTIWKSMSLDGGLTWQPEQKVAAFEGADICEPAVIRSPDGKQLACLMRENRRRYNSMLIVSNDEGQTWSDPVELPLALTGDRHLPRYAKDGRLVIPFRDMGKGSPTYGDFVAWVGRYDDLVNRREGQYRIRLLNSPKKVDLGYPGLELLPDDTFVATTYAVLEKGQSHSVVSIRFKIAEIDEKARALAAPPIETATDDVRIISQGDEVCHNIYGEMPFMDAASRYVIYLRLPGAIHAPASDREAYRRAEVWRADLRSGEAQLIANGVLGMKGMAVSSDQRYFYYVSSTDTATWQSIQAEELTRVDVATLEKKTVSLRGEGRCLTTMGTVGRDPDVYFAGARLGAQRYGIVRIDMRDGRVGLVHESNTEIFNAHPQVDPGGSKVILIQHNRGAQVDKDGNIRRAYGPMGTTLYTVDFDGRNRQSINVGKPFGPTIQGHQAWIGNRGEVLFTTHWGTPQQRAERGNIWTIRPGDAGPRPLARGYTFWHCNASRCGRYFVADTRGGPIIPNPDPESDSPYIAREIPARGLIVVGSIATGKAAILCETKADCAQAQHSHPHVYFSPDTRWAVFNSKRNGVPHVAAAQIPDGLLESLDQR